MNFLRIITGFLILSFLFSCSGQKDKFAKNWKATDVSLNGAPFKAADLGGMAFNFKSSGEFEYIENGGKETGTWTVSDDGKEITLKYPDREVKQKVIKQEEKLMVVEYSDHAMPRVMTLVAE